MSLVSHEAAGAKQNKVPTCALCHLDIKHTATACIAFHNLAREHQLEKEISALSNNATKAEHQKQTQKTCEEQFEETVAAYKRNLANETYEERRFFNRTAE